MVYSLKHKLKRVLIKYKLLHLLQPFYDIYLKLSFGQKIKYKKRQQELINFYSQFIKPGDLCFNIGANYGERVEAFLKLGAKVLAVEPQADCAEYLKNKFGKNPKFKLVDKGVADKEGRLTLYICEESNTLSTFYDKWKTGRYSDYKWNKQVLVSVTTLDNLIKEFGIPVFCKIKVKGFEQAVLSGLSQSIKYISLEYTEEFLKETKECLNYLNFLGYHQFNADVPDPIDSKHSLMSLLLSEWVSSEEIIKQLEKGNHSSGNIYAKI